MKKYSKTTIKRYKLYLDKVMEQDIRPLNHIELAIYHLTQKELYTHYQYIEEYNNAIDEGIQIMHFGEGHKNGNN